MAEENRQESGLGANELRNKAIKRLLREHERAAAPARAEGGALCPASVLVPIIERPGVGGASILLTRRTSGLPQHAGQIAFPGGKIAPGDASIAMTALRETEEETGIEPEFIDLLGSLDSHVTGTGFVIYPVVGIVRPGFLLRPCVREVDEVFEVPLDFLMRAEHYRVEEKMWRGRPKSFRVIDYDSYHIWGATALILKQLQERLFG